eukprot:13837241-Heterocapsa_arctica.AAC.1
MLLQTNVTLSKKFNEMRRACSEPNNLSLLLIPGFQRYGFLVNIRLKVPLQESRNPGISNEPFSDPFTPFSDQLTPIRQLAY